MEFTGCSYDGDVMNGRMEGVGIFTFPNGDKYEGEFKDGMFHGQGTIYFANGSKFTAVWESGKVIEGKAIFADGLTFQKDNWDYCTPYSESKDRRFYSERTNKLQPAGGSQLTNEVIINNEDGSVVAAPPPAIPPGTYDIGNGYFDPETERIYSYEGEVVRTPDSSEVEWILSKCRIGK